MAELNTGKLTQIIGAVLDVRFSEGKLPEINDAIKVPLKDGTSNGSCCYRWSYISSGR